jgi:hypothetical protein
VAELAALGHWPQACPPELRAHIDSCRRCADLLLVTRAFQTARAASAAQATLPAPGQLWWRAQLRRRKAAVERVSKPILGAQIFALAVILLAAGGLVISQARQGLNWLSWFSTGPTAALHVDSLWPGTLLNPGWSLSLLIPILASVALLSAVALYFGIERK